MERRWKLTFCLMFPFSFILVVNFPIFRLWTLNSYQDKQLTQERLGLSNSSYLLPVKVVAVLSKDFVHSSDVSEGDEAKSPEINNVLTFFSFSFSSSHLERLVVGSFITITSAISPNLAKYSFSPSVIINTITKLDLENIYGYKI